MAEESGSDIYAQDGSDRTGNSIILKTHNSCLYGGCQKGMVVQIEENHIMYDRPWL